MGIIVLYYRWNEKQKSALLHVRLTFLAAAARGARRVAEGGF
ncbi:hypothetical protein CLOBOL_07071 [Enterocloster bolteae ATCC BAA-613]|uniref:Uncharacterized protein n=1 Tax=Enterocloster bolteae (strain ATCC BAA-613 / DSM 15670 / CCUG 46953 / JCM 12243 / WAL 16351) TaxID=411902 RepID=A8S4T6_ENTBW|nr:hypothetical protein CLOBOL_07071 [Enterocloster bolteae ATCC BAA-613]